MNENGCISINSQIHTFTIFLFISHRVWKEHSHKKDASRVWWLISVWLMINCPSPLQVPVPQGSDSIMWRNFQLVYGKSVLLRRDSFSYNFFFIFVAKHLSNFFLSFIFFHFLFSPKTFGDWLFFVSKKYDFFFICNRHFMEI